MHSKLRRSALAGTAVLAVALTSCAGSPSEAGTQATAASSDKISIVTSTNTYSDIAEAVGGGNVSATAIIDSISQDPHSYEGTARDRLALSEADLVIRNGGGFDPFMEQLAGDADVAAVIDAFEVSGLDAADGDEAQAHEAHEDEPAGEHADEHDHSHGAVNEHVWYSVPAMARIADEIAEQLAKLDPENAATYESNAAVFTDDLATLEGRVADLREKHEGSALAATAPLAEHLLTDVGLVDKTPEGFIAAIEAGNDAPPAELKEAQDLLTSGNVVLLAYNSQVEGPQSESLKSLARETGVPVVDFTETLPEDVSYVEWMSGNIDKLEAALQS
jgi:zinc/manganese transport system substrate-binding protein